MNSNILKKSAVGIIAGMVVVLYYSTFLYLKEQYTGVDSYYSHGFLVPIISGYLLWLKREKLKRMPISSSPAGLALLTGGVLLHIFSSWWGMEFASAFSLVMVVGGLVLYLAGKEVTSELSFPLFFLFFMVPLPFTLTFAVTVRMKVFATVIAVKLLNLMAIPTTRAGAIITLPHTTMEVGNPCSGLRSLISLLALGAVFAYLLSASQGKRWFLFAVSVPLALLCNIIRIILLCFVAHVYGRDIALGFFHDFSGFLLFAIAFIGLVSIKRALTEEAHK